MHRALVLLALAACSGYRPAPSMKVDAARVSSAELVERCLESAAAVGDSDVGCVGPANDAAATRYAFTVTAPADATLEAACEGFVTRVNDCSDSPLDVEDPCPTWARVERPELATVYACYANASCDRLESCDTPRPTPAGTELCAALERLAGTDVCGDEMRADLNSETAWLREDALAAGRTCLAATTSAELETCLNAWMLAARL